MNRSTAAAILAALILAACNPPADTPAPRQAEAATTPAPDVPNPEAGNCEHVGELFDLYAKRKADGWTEAGALKDLSARGDYSLGYVVDGVFGDRYGEPGSGTARAEVLVTCRRLAKGGDVY